MNQYQWPYENELNNREEDVSDVLVLGGGIAGCYAAIAAARKGMSVTRALRCAAARREAVLTTGSPPVPIPVLK